MVVDEILNRAMAAYREGRLADALVILREARKIDPANPRIRSFMALLSGGTAGMTPVPGSFAAFVPPPAASRPGAATAAAPGGAPLPRPVSSAPVTGVEDGEGSDYAPAPWDEGPSAVATIVLDPGGGLDLDAVGEKSDLRPIVPQSRAKPLPEKQQQEVATLMQAARELHGLGDFSGSLELIEKILQTAPDHAEAREFLAQNEATLFAMYESKLQPLSNVPRLAIKPEEIMWLNLDHRAGFLLAQIDGMVAYDDLFALSGLPRLDTARILASLLSEGVITHGAG